MRVVRRAVLGGGAVLASAAGAAIPGEADPEALEAAARGVLAAPVYDFIAGGAGAELTQHRNRAALDAATITPRVLTGAGVPDLSLRLLGSSLPHPVLVCPMGLQGLAHPEAEVATAAGAGAAGALFMAAMVATRSLEAAAAAAPAAPRWFQMYVPRDRAIALDLAGRAAAAGYSALVLTVDAAVAAFRERDRRHGFVVPAGMGAGNDRPGYAHPLLGGTDAGFAWADVAWLRARVALPIVLKGILHAHDAARAVGAGAAAIIVSSHGGRQFDGAPASFDALPRCAAAVGGRIPVLLDSGPRRGIDVLKALAAGAQAVAIGRPVWWGLALGGAEGVRAVLARIVEELATAMRLAGCGSLAEVGRGLLDPPG